MISYIFYYNIILQTFIGSILVVLGVDNHYVISRMGDDARLFGWLSVMYMMIAFPMGMLISKTLLMPHKSMRLVLSQYVSRPVDVQGINGDALRYSLWFFTALSVLACLYTFLVIGYYPFQKVLAASGSEMSSIRISVSRDFGGNVYIRNIVALTLMPILSYAWVFYYINTKKTSDLVGMILTLFFSVSILYYNFEKSPLLWYVLSFAFVYYYAFGRFNVRYAVRSVVIVVAGIMVMYSLSGVAPSEFLSYNRGPVGRVILGQSAGLFAMFEVFPNSHDHIGFASLSQLMANIFDYDYVDRAARIVMTIMNPWGVEAGTAGVMNTIFIGEAWANFGVIGVLIAPLWVGFVLQSLYMIFLTRPKNPIYLAFFVFFSVGGSVTGGFNDYIYNGGVVIVLVILASIVMLSSMLRSNTTTKLYQMRRSVV